MLCPNVSSLPFGVESWLCTTVGKHVGKQAHEWASKQVSKNKSKQVHMPIHRTCPFFCLPALFSSWVREDPQASRMNMLRMLTLEEMSKWRSEEQKCWQWASLEMMMGPMLKMSMARRRKHVLSNVERHCYQDSEAFQSCTSKCSPCMCYTWYITNSTTPTNFKFKYNK